MPTKELGEGDTKEETSSQGDTEPLTFEDEADAEGEMDDDQDMLEVDATNAMMASSGAAQGTLGNSLGIQDINMAGVEEEDEDAEAESDADEEGEENADVDGDGDEDGMGSDDDDDDDEDDGQGPSRSQTTEGNNSPSKVAAGATFSDESDLTDEPDEDDEDAEGEDEEDEEEGDDEAEDDDEGDEDEAAKGLAALTSGQEADSDDGGVDASVAASSANSGLDGLAVLAAVEGDEDSQGEVDTDNDSIAGSQVKVKTRKPPSAIPRRTATRLNEVIVASPQLSEDDNDDEEEEEDAEGSGTNGRGSLLKSATASNKGSRGLSSLLGLSNIAKRNAKQGAAGLLAGAPSITIEGLGSEVPSAATSREVSPVQDEGEEGRPSGDYKNDLEQMREEAGTPIQEIDEAQAEDEPTTDEAALRRQEAMEALAKIEIGFAHLRDKLYVERMDEVSKEGEMILDGTHPDLIHLSNLIENRREKKLKLVDKWFEQEEKQYERVAKAEEAAAWNNWRNEVVELRKQMMNEAARKRRKLDREKRSLDGPRPARRHQIFETELVRNPDYDRKMKVHHRQNKKGKNRDDNEMGAYLAFPDLRGAADHESWMDMEQMGIATDSRFVGMGPGGGYYRPEDVAMDPYAMYAMEQPVPGAGAGFAPYGAPAAAEFAPFERPYDNRGYVVDGYGRPLSPPPPPPPSAPHAFSNAPPAQRSVNRTADSYGQVEPSHHPHSSYGANSKVNRRSPPPATVDERDLKHYSKAVDNVPIRTLGQRHNSPPIGTHQGVRPPSSSRPPSMQYAKQGNPIQEEGYYNSPNKSSMTAAGPASVPARPKVGHSGPAANDVAGSYNRHAQDHHYTR